MDIPGDINANYSMLGGNSLRCQPLTAFAHLHPQPACARQQGRPCNDLHVVIQPANKFIV